MITDDEVLRLFERADPARRDDAHPDVDDAAGYLAALRTRSSTTAGDHLPADAPDRRRRRSVVVAAAAAVAVAVVVSGAVLLARDDTGHQDVRATGDADTEVAVVTARRFMGAWATFNADRALSYLSDDAVAAEWGSAADFRSLLSFLEVLRTKTLNIDCEPGRSDVGVLVRCDYDEQMLGSDEMGLGPYGGGYWDITVQDQRIAAISHGFDGPDTFGVEVWEPFRDWVEAEYPADLPVMYDGHGWRISDESIPLWKAHIQEYVDARKVGFIGLPPAGAEPSTPAHADLVLAFYGGTTEGPRTRSWMYADGRLISQQEGPLPYGANRESTGYLEQRLSPEGVELVRSQVISTGLFDESRDLRIPSDVPCVNSIEVRNGDRLVQVGYSHGCGGEVLPEATPQQATELRRLDARLGDPASWLPAAAWEDRHYRPYVPSRFAICYFPDPTADPVSADQILASLPQQVAVVLRNAATSTEEGYWFDPPAVGAPLAFEQSCSQVTTDEARSIADAFEQAGHRHVDSDFVLGYVVAVGPADEAQFEFEPIFPHGEWTCSDCG